jgi:hypothetical protein
VRLALPQGKEVVWVVGSTYDIATVLDERLKAVRNALQEAA